MAQYAHDDATPVVIIGSGAGGGTLANELCQKGIDVVLLEAGARQSSAASAVPGFRARCPSGARIRSPAWSSRAESDSGSAGGALARSGPGIVERSPPSNHIQAAATATSSVTMVRDRRDMTPTSAPSADHLRERRVMFADCATAPEVA